MKIMLFKSIFFIKLFKKRLQFNLHLFYDKTMTVQP